jgi:hypothetical protein
VSMVPIANSNSFLNSIKLLVCIVGRNVIPVRYGLNFYIRFERNSAVGTLWRWVRIPPP